MCRDRDSIAKVDRAMDALKAACLKICGDDIGAALKATYNGTLAEPVPDDFLAMLRRLPDGDSGGRH